MPVIKSVFAEFRSEEELTLSMIGCTTPTMKGRCWDMVCIVWFRYHSGCRRKPKSVPSTSFFLFSLNEQFPGDIYLIQSIGRPRAFKVESKT